MAERAPPVADEAEPVVIVVDDDASVRGSLRRLLSSEGFKVLGFANAQEFLASAPSAGPSCLVLDVKLPGPSGLDLQARLATTEAPPPIVFLTGHGDIPMSVKAIKAGATEFLTKPFRPEELLASIRQALAQDRAARRDRSERLSLRTRYQSLTTREQAVMAGVVEGLPNKQIAAQFGTKEATVKEQRAQVMHKMQAGSLPELVRMAARLGLSGFPAPAGPLSRRSDAPADPTKVG